MRATDRTEYIVNCIRDAGSMYPDDAAAFLAEHDAHRRAEVLTEAADELDRIADTVEARVAEHYGPASGIGPGSARMLRDAAGNVRYMARKDTREGESTVAAPDFFQPGRTYQSAQLSFRCIDIDTHPDTHEQRAIGWMARGERWHRIASLNPDDWEQGGWTETTAGGGR